MENKPQNVFEKLDKQGEQIDDISQRLEGISINDLYALAKRTWDYGDFQTAQKYYNHISLLKPLDWEAPLYASLCNFKGYHDMFFWTKVPEQTEKIIISTLSVKRAKLSTSYHCSYTLLIKNVYKFAFSLLAGITFFVIIKSV